MNSDRPAVTLYGSAPYSQPLSAGQARKFRALGNAADVTVVGTSQVRRFETFEEAGARFILLPLPRRHSLRFPIRHVLATIVLTGLAVTRRADAVAVQSPFDALPALVAKRVTALVRRRSIGMVVESHGDFRISPFMERTEPMHAAVRKLLVRLAIVGIRRADVLRCVSVATWETLREVAPEDVPVRVYPAWIDLEPFRDIERKPRAGLFVYAGSIIPRKGILELVAAFAHVAAGHTAARLVIAGPESDAVYAGSLREFIRENGLEQKVDMLGSVPHEQLGQLFANAAAVVLPSYAEGFPRVLVEAMAAGAPVIATDVSGVPELVRHNLDGILVPSGDSHALSMAMSDVLEDPEAARNLGLRGRDRALSLYSGEEYARHYVDGLKLAVHRALGGS